MILHWDGVWLTIVPHSSLQDSTTVGGSKSAVLDQVTTSPRPIASHVSDDTSKKRLWGSDEGLFDDMLKVRL